MDSERRLQRQFTVVQGWTIRVKPDDAARTLNTAIIAGANESGWIEWKVENSTIYEAQASAKALADAQAIAEKSAKQLNVHLGSLFSASEGRGGGELMNGFVTAGAGGILGGIGMGNGMQSQIDPLAITSRRIEFRATMQAVFLLE